jgi:uncharacterized protein YcbK (DUF882 family)
MITRRDLLQFACAAGIGAAGIGAAGIGRGPAKRLAERRRRRGFVIRHLATGEAQAFELGGDGGASAAIMAGIETILRDPATDECGRIDPHLISQLLDIAAEWTPLPVFDVLDAYRSSSRTAGTDLHRQGRAIDLRLCGIASADLAARAAVHARGGVGYYRCADFVHLDTGAPRRWLG